MKIQSELMKILIITPAAAFFMFGLDYFFIKNGKLGIWLLIISFFVFYLALKAIKAMNKTVGDK